MDRSLQHRFAPHDICYGCGPANPDGFQLQSFVADHGVVAEWTPQDKHLAFPGVLNGGVIGTLLDCHCNWAAAWGLAVRDQLAIPPCTVTAEYTVRLLAPTPLGGPVQLRATLVNSSGRRGEVYGELSHQGTVKATCRGLFIAVKPEHPAFVHRHAAGR